MTFKIETYRDEHGTTIRLIGRMRAEHLSDLEKQIRENESRIVLDLEELDLIDVEAVRFLGMCERQGVTLLNYSPYIRHWIGKAAESGIRVNMVSPGPVETGMLNRFTGTAERKASLAATVPLNRVGTPEEIANTITFLASDKASFITGASYLVDGGKSAR